MTELKEPITKVEAFTISEKEDIISMGLLERLHCIMAEAPELVKEIKPGLQYPVISHDQVSDKIRPLLIKYRVLAVPSVTDCVQSGDKTKMTIAMTVCNIDDKKEEITLSMTALGIDKQDKGPGKAMSYACKYLYMKLFCMITGDDVDQGNDLEVPQTRTKGFPQEEVPRRTAEAPAPQSSEENGNWRNVKVHFPPKYVERYREEKHITDLRLGTLNQKEIWFLAEKWELRPYQGQIQPRDAALKRAAIQALKEYDNAKREDEVHARGPKEHQHEFEIPGADPSDDIPF